MTQAPSETGSLIFKAQDDKSSVVIQHLVKVNRMVSVLPSQLFCVHLWTEARVSAPPAAPSAGSLGLLTLVAVSPPDPRNRRFSFNLMIKPGWKCYSGWLWLLLKLFSCRNKRGDGFNSTFLGFYQDSCRCGWWFFCLLNSVFQLYIYVLSHQHVHFCLSSCTCSFPLSATVKEVSSDARALGIRAEMKSRRCWEAQLESGSGKDLRVPTKLDTTVGREGKRISFSWEW